MHKQTNVLSFLFSFSKDHSVLISPEISIKFNDIAGFQRPQGTQHIGKTGFPDLEWFCWFQNHITMNVFADMCV